jgi:hypothetical protein
LIAAAGKAWLVLCQVIRKTPPHTTWDDPVRCLLARLLSKVKKIVTSKKFIMKKQMSQRFVSVRNVLVKSLMIVMLAVNAMPFAAGAQAPTSGKPSPVIRYIGMEDDKVFFQLEVDNKESESVSIIIKDEEGNILFEEKFRERKISRKFQVNKSELQGGQLSFVLATAREKQTHTFQVVTRVVEDVVVTRL